VLGTNIIDAGTRESLVSARRHVAVVASLVGVMFIATTRLQVINEIAPSDRRAEMVSTYFMAGFAGNALSVIGVGIMSSLASPVIASVVFAATIAVFAVLALIVARQYLSNLTG
jgi:hypothetical protein